MATTDAPPGGWRAGFRTGAALGAGGFLLAVSFGAFAVTNGWPAWLAILMSAVAFAGSAQFALVAAYGGGGLGPGLVSAGLMNLRFVPMGAATARYLHGGPLRRAVEGQAVVDASWVAAQRSDGGLDRELMIAATMMQWPAWVAGTAVGALAVPGTELIHTIGLDLVFPAFFAVLLVDSLTAAPTLLPVAVAGAAVAAGACRIMPTGVALVLAAGAVAVTAWQRR